MQLLILGKNSDDKGSQLEELTKTILEHQGFTNIQLNTQWSGGNEIDVKAERVLEQIGRRDLIIPVICECKAHNNPITLPDWLKFIGKLYIARKKKPNTIGLMLSLSGANSSVMGCIDNDFTDDDNTQLLANESLRLILSEIFNLPTTSMIREIITKESQKNVEEVSLIYYNNKVYWLIVFDDYRFTMYRGDGVYLGSDKVKKILSLIEKETSLKKKAYVDVAELKNYNKLEAKLRALVINDCIKEKSISIEDFFKIAESLGLEIDNVNSFFSSDKVIRYNDSLQNISLNDVNDSFLQDFYKTILFSDYIPIDLLKSQFYQNHIDNNFLKIVEKIQYGFKIDPKYYDEVIFILRYSPSALMYSLIPDSVLHANSYPFIDEGMKRLYQSHFISRLSEAFRRDFTNQALSRFYYESGIVRMKINTNLSFGKGEKNKSLETKRTIFLAPIDGTDQIGVLVAKDEDC